MNKHTPGPWSVDDPDQIWAESVGEYVAITQVEDWETIPREQAEANARLIAAAPELLDFVEEYIGAFENGMADESYLYRIAKAAIAKAIRAKGEK
jgi:predicted P-loop ATPase